MNLVQYESQIKSWQPFYFVKKIIKELENIYFTIDQSNVRARIC